MKIEIVPECIKLEPDSVGGNRKEWEIDQEGKLWPCCVWIQGWDHYGNGEVSDDKLAEMVKNNPNFNDLKKYSWEEVTQHPIYKSYINFDGWNSDSPPSMCLKTCGVERVERTEPVIRQLNKKTEE